MGVRQPAVIVGLAVVFALTLAADSASGTVASERRTLRVVHSASVPTLDPALAPRGWGALWDAVCASLMVFRDKPAPDGLHVVPEAAASAPTVIAGRTYVFTVRRGLRFSDGSRITAANFARALGRVLNPIMRSPGAELFADVKRVSASGRRLRIDLREPSGDLPIRLASAYACPVPLGFPLDPAGTELTVGSGPYYLAANDPGKQLVIERNRFYRGTRPHHVDRIVVTVGAPLDENIRAVAEGRADILATEIPSERRGELAQRYGVNRGQLFRTTGTAIRALQLNVSRPLFRGNAALRKAINLALDRQAIRDAGGSPAVSVALTDQLLTHWMPGWVDQHLYPLARPNLQLARRLAQPSLRGGKAILWVSSDPDSLDQAAVIVRNLREIELEVEVKPLATAVINARASVPGAPYDMILGSMPLTYPDPANLIVRLLAGENARKAFGNDNYSYFDVPAYNRRMAAAEALTGSRRARAFARLDADIMRKEAPWAPLYEHTTWLLVSKSVGCLKMHPVFRIDAAAVCLR